jgi:hypothetical protein
MFELHPLRLKRANVLIDGVSQFPGRGGMTIEL